MHGIIPILPSVLGPQEMVILPFRLKTELLLRFRELLVLFQHTRLMG